MSLRKKPDFLIVGAAKSGTTSLAKYLNMHPDVFSPSNKEPRFFVKNTLININESDPLKDYIINKSVLQEKDYFDLYKHSIVGNKITYDASVQYLFHYKEAIPNILSYLGDVPIIIMLRSPSNRSISAINYLSKWHNNSLKTEFKLEQERFDKNYNSMWYYKRSGLYFDQVKAYFDNFSKVKIIFFDRFISDVQSQYNEVLSFLSLNTYHLDELTKFNSSAEPSFYLRMLRKYGLVESFKKLMPIEYWEQFKDISFSYFTKKDSKIENSLDLELRNYFLDDIIKLEGYLNEDLSNWK